MRPLADQLQSRVDAARARQPDADPDAIAGLLWHELRGTAALDDAFAAFSQGTRSALIAHGHWPAWDDRALALIDGSTALGAIAQSELNDAGWLDDGGRFPLVVRAWRRATQTPTLAMTTRAATAAEEAFHWSRRAGTGDPVRHEELLAWGQWHTAPDVAQWAALSHTAVDDACPPCAPWAAIEQSRAARWRGYDDQAARWLDRAEATSTTPEARFFVRFLRAVRAVQDGDPQSPTLVSALSHHVPHEAEWLFVRQAEAVLAQATDADPRPALQQGIGLAQALKLRFREAHLRLLRMLAEWPDGPRMVAELELIDTSGLVLSDRDRWNFAWGAVRAHLADGNLPEAARHARHIVEDDALAALNSGGSWGTIGLAEAAAGRPDAARRALVEARKHLTGDDGQELRRWFERVHGGGPYEPLPKLAMARRLPTGWIRSDGSAFAVHDGEPVDVRNSRVSVALLRRLARGPHTADELIGAAWPGDASSYPSLKGRLHAALRVLRRRGLQDHLVLEDGVYRLDRLRVVG